MEGMTDGLPQAFAVQLLAAGVRGCCSHFPHCGRRQSWKAQDSGATSQGSLCQPYIGSDLADTLSRCSHSFEYVSGEVLERAVRKDAEA